MVSPIKDEVSEVSDISCVFVDELENIDGAKLIIPTEPARLGILERKSDMLRTNNIDYLFLVPTQPHMRINTLNNFLKHAESVLPENIHRNVSLGYVRSGRIYFPRAVINNGRQTRIHVYPSEEYAFAVINHEVPERLHKRINRHNKPGEYNEKIAVVKNYLLFP